MLFYIDIVNNFSKSEETKATKYCTYTHNRQTTNITLQSLIHFLQKHTINRG